MVKASAYSRPLAGFTLVELLVSIAIVAILLAVLTQITDGVRRVTSNSRQDVKEFQQARNAFEVMTRRIGQATLNSYNDVNPATGLYSRASELRFITGNAGVSQTIKTETVPALLPTALQTNTTTDAIFFQAPLGRFSSGTPSTTYQQLANALNTCGYFIEYTSDADPDLNLRPTFLVASTTYVTRWRYRLMELMEPSDQLQIYNYTSGIDTTTATPQTLSWNYSLSNTTTSGTALNWYQKSLGSWNPASPGSTASSPPYVHVLADDIIFLAVLPMLAPQNATIPSGGDTDGTSTDIAPYYFYDTSQSIITGTGASSAPDSLNRLPPMVFLEMIAVDDASFIRFQAANGSVSSPPTTTLGLNGILTNATYSNRVTDVATVTAKLNKYHISYQIFTAVVPISSR